jgi:lipoprotein-anchoring transpeptidase ErfK/SrfK
MTRAAALLASVAVLALAACSQGSDADGTKSGSAAPKPASQTNSMADQAGQGAPGGLTLQAVNDAQFKPGAAGTGGSDDSAPDNEINGYDNATGNATGSADVGDGKTANPLLLKAEVLLDRANVSPGVMDGRMGENVRNALKAYQQMHSLDVSGELDQATWNSLTAADKAPVLKTYTLTQQDVAGPWSQDVGEDFVKMSQQPALGYTSPKEMLAERFHMDEQLLTALNPSADLTKAGTQIVVVDPGQASLPEVKSIDVDKGKEEVIALDADGKPVGVFPATVGSTTRPSPKGTWKVTGVSQNPDYMYDPKKLTWGPKHAGKLHIPPGPNNPVGVVWIALSAPDYGIHGSPDPHVIGKTASHGCVRLTNWDVEELSKAVRSGVKVTFMDDRS